MWVIEDICGAWFMKTPTVGFTNFLFKFILSRQFRGRAFPFRKSSDVDLNSFQANDKELIEGDGKTYYGILINNQID